MVICVLLGVTVAYQETKIISKRQVQYVPVLALKEDAPINTLLTKGMLEYKNYPKSVVNDQFVIIAEDATNKYITRSAKAGTPLFVSDLSAKQTVVVPSGMVRVTIATGLTDSLAGAIEPGTAVNLGYVSKEGQEAQTLLTNVLIARITDKSGVEINNGASSEKKTNRFAREEIIPATVTVILTPEDAVLLKQYEARGRVFIMGY